MPGNARPEPIGDGRQQVNVFIGFLLWGFTDHVATLFGRFRRDQRAQNIDAGLGTTNRSPLTQRT
jgi:hypothetical protein